MGETSPDIVPCYTSVRQPTLTRRLREVGEKPTRCRHCKRGAEVASFASRHRTPAVRRRPRRRHGAHTGRGKAQRLARRSASQETGSPGSSFTRSDRQAASGIGARHAEKGTDDPLSLVRFPHTGEDRND